MKILKTNEKAKFSMLQFFTWGAWATFGQYYIFYLLEHGYKNSQIAIIITLYTIASMVGQCLCGYFSDFLKTIKKIYIGLTLILIISILLFPHISSNNYIVIGVVICIGFSFAPLGPLLDSWILKTKKIKQSDYGSMRLWASIGYACICLIMGKCVQTIGWNAVFIGYFIIALPKLFITLKIKDVNKEGVENKEKKPNPRKLVKNREYIQLLIYCVITFISYKSILDFYPIIIKNVGGTPMHLGIAASLAAAIEVPFFILSKRLLKKYEPLKIMFVVSCIFVLRVFTLSFATTPLQVILTAILQAIAFATFLSTLRVYIGQIAPKELLTTAQSIGTIFYGSLAGIISSLIGGYILDYLSINIFFQYLRTVSIISLVIIIIYNYQFSNKKKETKQVLHFR